MKALCLFVALFPATLTTALHADLIAQWNFNGSVAPCYGLGTAALIGGTTGTFAGGCTNDPSAGNQGWNTAHYPAQGTNNKTAGVQFNVSTLGYSGIVIRWDHRVSNSASKYCRLQYAADGSNFVDFEIPVAAREVSGSSSYFEPQTNSLAALPWVEDNPNFAFRIVSEMENTALGYGTEAYVTTYGTNNYSTAGTIRFDLVTVTGTPIPGGNTPPHISAVADQTVRVSQSIGPVGFTVSDAEDFPENLRVRAETSDETVVPLANIRLAGTGAARTVALTAANHPGAATITLSVIDSGDRSNLTSFVVTVLPANTAPFLSAVAPTNTLAGTAAGPIPFAVGDLETPADALAVACVSDNPGLVPNDAAHIAFGGAGSNRTVTLAPLPGQSGVAPLTLRVSDGTNLAQCRFALMVLPSATLALLDPFSYPNGSVVTNSGWLWDTRSGAVGECQVTNGQLRLTSAQTEDVAARLAGGPFVRSNGVVLYAAFRMSLAGVPRSTPEYFAHFVGGSSLRGRVYVAAAESFPGGYQVLAANGSDTTTAHAAVLSTNTVYTVVTRYDIDNASTTVWIDPASEADPGVTATDPQSPVSITAYGFRQDTGLGTSVLVDDAKVGLSFAAVTREAGTAPTLRIERAGTRVVLSWSDPAYGLQAAPFARGGFTNVPSASSPHTNTATGSARYYRLFKGL
jgi:hypothetical protein